ncbi:hypothetical protein BN1058_01847 [Paraliobacillus sp. PM-2]|uniref:hypothetical protein n=1 Tax=Paraliobacillus sp. PM-2 TaxID=1462524 RepID=UPI00061C5B55|nr:hypothetical protein [Paraliobacillus sp. PM-2]CQR47524.1 hypothetical protein BN1058_01847 [Paraliobacillus sp. PM-2]
MTKHKLFVFVLFLFLAGCSNQDEVLSNGEFLIENVSVDQLIPSSKLEPGVRYFIVMPFKWSGSQPAEIQSIDIIENGKRITENSGIAYTFYIGDPMKKTGVYKRKDIGEKKSIKGFTINDANTLILELSLLNIESNDNRSIHIKYLQNGEKKEQILQSSLLENLSTSNN